MRLTVDERLRRLESRVFGGVPEVQRYALIVEASELFEVRCEEILGPSKITSVVAARRWVCKRLQERGFTVAEIGAMMGREHSSVLYLLGRTAKARSRKRALLGPKGQLELAP